VGSEQPSLYSSITLGRVRPDGAALVAESELSFWSRAIPLFVTKEGQLIPAATNRPTARVSLYRSRNLYAIDADAYPRFRLRKHWTRSEDLARALRPSGALGRFIGSHVIADACIVTDVLRWIAWDGKSDAADTARSLSSHWQWKHEASDVVDARDIPEGIANTLLLERWDACNLVARVARTGEILADGDELERKRASLILTAVVIGPRMLMSTPSESPRAPRFRAGR
jgi:hypothetical protein